MEATPVRVGGVRLLHKHSVFASACRGLMPQVIDDTAPWAEVEDEIWRSLDELCKLVEWHPIKHGVPTIVSCNN